MKKRNVKKFKNTVVLLSGGLDSSTCAYYVRHIGKSQPNQKIFTLTFNYGQKHKKELTSARLIASEIKSSKHAIIKFNLGEWGGSALTDLNIKVPKNRNLKEKSIPITYVPARNTIFLAFALSYAEAVNASEIYIGVNALDYSGYIDCRPSFIKKFQELTKVATVAGSKETIKIKTPLIHLTKAEIVKLGEKVGVDWSKTWSCYEGGKLACGECDSCRLRLKGFKEAGVKDRIRYKVKSR
jgi:7-cyano-7-deazaguanine synthase